MPRTIRVAVTTLVVLVLSTMAHPAHAGIGTNGVDLTVHSQITVVGEETIQVPVHILNLESTPRNAALYAASFDGSVGGQGTAKYIKFDAVNLQLGPNEGRTYTMTVNGASLPHTSEALKDALVLQAGTTGVVARAAQVITITHIPAKGETYPSAPVKTADTPEATQAPVTQAPAPTPVTAAPAAVNPVPAKAPVKAPVLPQATEGEDLVQESSLIAAAPQTNVSEAPADTALQSTTQAVPTTKAPTTHLLKTSNVETNRSAAETAPAAVWASSEAVDISAVEAEEEAESSNETLEIVYQATHAEAEASLTALAATLVLLAGISYLAAARTRRAAVASTED